MVMQSTSPASSHAGALNKTTTNTSHTPTHNNSVPLRRGESGRSSKMATNSANYDSMLVAMPNYMTLHHQQQQQQQARGLAGQQHRPMTASSPSLLNPTSQPQASAGVDQSDLPTTKPILVDHPMTPFHFTSSRVLLFSMHALILVALIVNTFVHFLAYGSTMSIGALFLDVHHRQQLINGEYYHLNLVSSPPPGPHDGSSSAWSPPPTVHRGHNEMMHCDRSQFFSVLEEFYHQYQQFGPSQPQDDTSNSNFNQPTYPEQRRNNSFHNVLDTILSKNRQQNANRRNKGAPELGNEELYYSSSSTSGRNIDIDSRRIYRTSEELRKLHEHRLLVIEIVALVLLFLLVFTQVLGLISVMRKSWLLAAFVAAVNMIILSLLLFASTFGLIMLLLLVVLFGLWFVFELRHGLDKSWRARAQLTEELKEAMLSASTANNGQAAKGRHSPCVHVSMEQYEAMTQQMLHRYSSPIVYCPHYNESLC